MLAGADRLPTRLRWLLASGAWLAMLLSGWRASPVLIASSVGLPVYLKLNHLAEMTWRQVAVLGTGVVRLPIALGYTIALPLAGWIAVGIVPFALARC